MGQYILIQYITLDNETKKAIRIVCKAQYLEHTNLLFYIQHILKLTHIIELKSGIIMYKAYNDMLPYNLQIYFEKSICRRQIHCFKQKFVRTTKKQHCISYCGVKFWNSLDEA